MKATSSAALSPLGLGLLVSCTTHRCLRPGQKISRVSDAELAGEHEELLAISAVAAPPRVPTGSRSKRKQPSTGSVPARRPAPQQRTKSKPSASVKKEEVTLKQLIAAGLLSAGKKKLFVTAGGSTTQAGVLSSGTISCTGRFFDSVEDFAIHVARRAGLPKTQLDPWTDVLYDGKPLSQLRDTLIGKDADSTDEEEEEDEEEDYDDGFWIQCDSCETWRIVPDEVWPALQADTLDSWFCRDATWDLTAYVPYTQTCKRQKPSGQ